MQKVSKKCPICGKSFFGAPYDHKTGGGKYCGKICASKAISGPRAWVIKTIDKPCQVCGEIFSATLKEHKRGNAKYCSIDCMKKGRPRKQNVENNICSWCNVPFYRQESHLKKSKSGLFFCSRACKNSAQSINGIKEIHPPHYGETDNYRDVAYRIYNNKCSICGYDRCQRAIKIHHIDKNRTNNKEENLIPLCGNCHDEVHAGFIKEPEWKILQNKALL